MKNRILILSLILALISCGVFLPSGNRVLDGPYEDQYPNGKLKQTGLIKRGEMQGNWKFYRPDGSLLAEGFYRNGTLNVSDTLGPPNKGRIGKWTFYYPDGKIRKTGTLEDDFMQGLWQFYTPEGNLDGQGRYQDGNGSRQGRTGVPIHGRVGTWKFFFPNGKLRAEYGFQDGALHGRSATFHESGNPRDVSFFKKGVQDSVALGYHDSGEPWFKANFKMGNRNGLHEEWYENGQPQMTLTYVDGQAHGKLEAWHENGQPKWLRNFDMGMEQGLSQAWHENGKLRQERTFADGKIQGAARTWYANGQLKYSVDYVDGLISGSITFWGEDGQPATEDLVKVETSMGTFVVDVYEQDAPVHATNFKLLAATGALDSTYFHRIISDFVVQGGDPLTRDNQDREDDGTGGIGENLPAEIGKLHLRGSLGAARDNNPEKSSSGSQFYICLKNLPNLDNEYTVFGEVVLGMDAVDRMAKVETDKADNPLQPIYILNTAVGTSF